MGNACNSLEPPFVTQTSTAKFCTLPTINSSAHLAKSHLNCVLAKNTSGESPRGSRNPSPTSGTQLLGDEITPKGPPDINHTQFNDGISILTGSSFSLSSADPQDPFNDSPMEFVEGILLNSQNSLYKIDHLTGSQKAHQNQVPTHSPSKDKSQPKESPNAPNTNSHI